MLTMITYSSFVEHMMDVKSTALIRSKLIKIFFFFFFYWLRNYNIKRSTHHGFESQNYLKYNGFKWSSLHSHDLIIDMQIQLHSTQLFVKIPN